MSSIGALDFRLDEWRVDVAVTGSQKALSLPTGLAVMAASPKVGLTHTFHLTDVMVALSRDCLNLALTIEAV